MTRHQRLLIIDLGALTTQLIARRMRELHIYCEIHPFSRVNAGFLADFQPQAIIIASGPVDTARPLPTLPDDLWRMGAPVLAIGLGQLVMVGDLGGRIAPAGPTEERVTLRKRAASPLIDGWFSTDEEPIRLARTGRIGDLPAGFDAVAAADEAPFAIIADDARRLYGVQFHPAADDTGAGERLLRNFAGIAGFAGDWSMASYRAEAVAGIRARVGDKRVICALSGGVDSSVTALLLHEAIGDRLTCVFVDHGLLRKNEARDVVTMFRDHYNIPLVHANEEERFLRALAGISDPEAKRKTIGRLFIDVFQERAATIADVEFLAQGTIYPDVIESVATASGTATTIKSHHNVGGLPERMGLKLVEPLRDLFKDEVRALGRELGLPAAFINRHPFPGPGLAVRCPGEVSRERLDILREADAIFIEQLHRHGLYDRVFQAFAAILPFRTVGMSGDRRTYEHAISLRAVTSRDGMTASAYPFTPEFLAETADRIIDRVAGVNRVLYDVTDKPPGTIELE